MGGWGDGEGRGVGWVEEWVRSASRQGQRYTEGGARAPPAGRDGRWEVMRVERPAGVLSAGCQPAAAPPPPMHSSDVRSGLCLLVCVVCRGDERQDPPAPYLFTKPPRFVRNPLRMLGLGCADAMAGRRFAM